MKFIRYLGLIVFIGSLLVSCKDNPQEGTLTLHFVPLYDGAPLQTFTPHSFDVPQQIRFTHMSLYISDLRLYDQSSEKNLDDIELVNISFDTPTAAEAGYTMTLSNVPAATYSGIRFGIGVPPEVNQKKPADFPSTSPLSKTGYYWEAWQSYIFMKTEGTLDTLGNGAFDLGFALHSGSDALFRSFGGPVPITIADGKETTLTIAIDYKKLLSGVDIKSHPQNHTPQDTSEIVKMVNNLDSAITLIH
jgi:hypothetical protein